MWNLEYVICNRFFHSLSMHTSPLPLQSLRGHNGHGPYTSEPDTWEGQPRSQISPGAQRADACSTCVDRVPARRGEFGITIRAIRMSPAHPEGDRRQKKFVVSRRALARRRDSASWSWSQSRERV